MVKQKENPWKLIPQYDKEGYFLGYALKDKAGKYVQRDDKKGPLIIGYNDKRFEVQKIEECDNGCIVRYKGSVWRISEHQLLAHTTPKIFYIPQMQDTQFLGYDVKQRGEVVGRLKPEDVSYEDNKSGGKNVFWRDAQGLKHFIENVSQEQFNARTGEESRTETQKSLGQKLSENAEKYDPESEKNNNIQYLTSKLQRGVDVDFSFQMQMQIQKENEQSH